MKRATIDDAFPLKWPAGVLRTLPFKRDHNRNFRLTFSAARDRLLAEVRRMGAGNVILSTDVPLRRDGIPYGDGDPVDPGAAVYFDLAGDPHVLACDRWSRLRMNTQALGLTVEALRGLERWGSTDIMQRAFGAFRALPPAIVTPRSWREILEIGIGSAGATLDAARDQYRRLARMRHPDIEGGDHAAMAELNAAMEAAERELGGGG